MAKTHQVQVEFDGDARQAAVFRREVEKLAKAFKTMRSEAEKYDRVQRRTSDSQRQRQQTGQRIAQQEKQAYAQLQKTMRLQSQIKRQQGGTAAGGRALRGAAGGEWQDTRGRSRGGSKVNQVMDSRVGGKTGGFGGAGMPRGAGRAAVGGGGGAGAAVTGGSGMAGMAGKANIALALLGVAASGAAKALTIHTKTITDPMEAGLEGLSLFGELGQAMAGKIRAQMQAYDDTGEWIKAFGGALAATSNDFQAMSTWIKGSRDGFAGLAEAAAAAGVHYKEVGGFIDALSTVGKSIGGTFLESIKGGGEAATSAFMELREGAFVFGTTVDGYLKMVEHFAQQTGSGAEAAKKSLFRLAAVARDDVSGPLALSAADFTATATSMIDGFDEFTRSSDEVIDMLGNLNRTGMKASKAIARFQDVTKTAQDAVRDNFAKALASGGSGFMKRLQKTLEDQTEAGAAGETERGIIASVMDEMRRGIVTQSSIDFLTSKLGPAAARLMSVQEGARGLGINTEGEMTAAQMRDMITRVGSRTGRTGEYAALAQEMDAIFSKFGKGQMSFEQVMAEFTRRKGPETTVGSQEAAKTADTYGRAASLTAQTTTQGTQIGSAVSLKGLPEAKDPGSLIREIAHSEWDSFKKSASEAIEPFKKAFKNLGGAVLDLGKSALEMGGKAVDTAKEIAAAIKAAMTEAFNKFIAELKAALNVIDKLIPQGLKDVGGAMVEGVKGAAGAAADAGGRTLDWMASKLPGGAGRAPAPVVGAGGTGDTYVDNRRTENNKIVLAEKGS